MCRFHTTKVKDKKKRHNFCSVALADSCLEFMLPPVCLDVFLHKLMFSVTDAIVKMCSFSTRKSVKN